VLNSPVLHLPPSIRRFIRHRPFAAVHSPPFHSPPFVRRRSFAAVHSPLLLFAAPFAVHSSPFH
jgi:hypothetical protein